MSERRDGLPILSFADAAEWGKWLNAHGKLSDGLWLMLAKKGNAKSRLTKPEAIDGALVHGWIDSQLNAYDESWFLVRFTPRKARSKWSERNRERAIALIAEGRMKPSGQAEIDAAKADGRWDAAYAPQSSATLPDDLAAALDRVSGARDFFDRLDSANRYAILYRVGEAKKPETRALRIAKFAQMCGCGECVHPPRKRE